MRDSRMDMMTSATSVATSTTSTTARRRTGTGSGGRRSGRDNGQPPPLSAAQIAEMEIQEVAFNGFAGTLSSWVMGW